MSPPYGLENLFKNTFPRDGKQLSLEGVSEKWQKINSTNQKISFHKQELPPPNFKSFTKALNKKNTFSTRQKNCFHSMEYLKNGKNCFPLARKTVFTRNKEVFL